MPARFTDFGHGLGYRWAGTCTAAKGVCRTIELYAYDTCASVYLEGELDSRAGKYLGVVSGTFERMRKGTTRSVPVTWSVRSSGPRLTAVDCE